MSNFGSDTPFILLAKLKVKEDKVIEAMKGTGVPFKVFKTQFGYSRV